MANLETLRPDGDGDATQFQRNTSDANYKCVYEAVADEDVTYVYIFVL